jgi:EAL domain-containing protein (putative c-di-GMP-specific phosphodiesterase class I)
VESQEEYFWLGREGVDLFQGYYFARPAFESLPNVARQRFALSALNGV